MPVPTTDLVDVTVTRGANAISDAPICVIVMSVHSETGTPASVRSILEQDIQAEIVVVNTGRGSVREMIAPYADRITLVETPSQQYAGGARNLGIRHSSAPIVAFLAADCLATPGWIKRRLDGHKTHRAVASAIRPAPTGNKVSDTSWAAYVIVHYLRMPEVEPELASGCGQSYDRSIFDECGLFSETMRIAEDSVFNDVAEKRFGKALWDPSIVTLHRYPSTFSDGMADTFRRGRRLTRQYPSKFALRTAIGSLKFNLQKAWKVRGTVPLNPFIFLGLAAARSAGILTGGRGDRS